MKTTRTCNVVKLCLLAAFGLTLLSSMSSAQTIRKIRTLLPEDDMPGRIAVAPDGETLLVGGGYLRHYVDNIEKRSKIYLLDLKTGRPRWRIDDIPEDSGLIQVAALPDGRRWVAAWGEAKQYRFIVILGDMADGSIRKRWEIPDKSAWNADFTLLPDGKSIMLHGGFDLNKCIVWNLEDGTRSEIAKSEGALHDTAFSKDGSLRLTGAPKGRLVLDEYPSGENRWAVTIEPVSGGTLEFPAVAFLDNDTKAVAFGHHRTPTTIWDVRTGKELCRLENFAFPPHSVAVTPDGRLIVEYAGGELNIWTTLSEESLSKAALSDPGLPNDLVFSGHKGQVQTVTASPDGSRIASGSQDDTVKLWDAATGKELRTFDEKDAEGWTAVRFSPDGQTLLGVGYSNVAALYPIFLRMLAFHGDAFLGESPYWELLAGITYHMDATPGIVRLWNVETGEAIHRFPASRRCWSADFSPDGRRFAVGSEEGKIRIFDIATKTCVKTFKTGFQVWSLSYDKTGTKLLAGVGSADSLWENLETLYKPGYRKVDFGAALLLDAESGAELLRFKGHDHAVFAAALSPDGKLVLTGSRDKTARLWDAKTGRELKRLTNFRAPVRGVTFSDDGSMFAVTGYDERAGIRVYDTRTFEESSHGGFGNAFSVRFSPDGKSLLLGTSRFSFCRKNLETMIDSREEPLPDFHAVKLLTEAKNERRQKHDVEFPFEKLDVEAERKKDAEREEIRRENVERSRLEWGRKPEKFEPRKLPGKTTELVQFVDWKTCNDASPNPLFFDGGGENLYACSNGLRMHRFDLADGREIARWKMNAFLSAVDEKSQNLWFVSGRFFCRYDLATENVVRVFSAPPATGEIVFGFDTFTPSDDGSTLLTREYSDTRSRRIWNVSTGEQIVEIAPERSPFQQLVPYALSPDGSMFVAGSPLGRIKRITVDPYREWRSLKILPSPVSAAFSPDGTKLLVVSYGETVLWEVRNGRKLWKIEPQGTGIRFSQDGKTIYFSGNENIAQVETRTGRLLRTQPLENISSRGEKAFSPDCTKFAYLDEDGFIRVIRIEPETRFGVP